MSLKQEIRQFMEGLGVEVVGFAGPGRFDGPPSLDPTYLLKGAQSIVSYAIPFDVDAIYDYLSKKSAIPHNIDQNRKMQRSMHIGLKLSAFLKKKGYQATTYAANFDYRRNPDVFTTYPKFAHRYGAYVSGIAAPGISGNAVTKEYGATVVLNTVFTDAVLESDPIMNPRHFFDGLCQHCKACTGACPPKMFEADQEEYTLINGQLYPRGLKRSIDLCNVACFGLHALSANKQFSTWGKTWQPDWVGKEPEKEGNNLKSTFIKAFISTMDLPTRVQPLLDNFRVPLEEGFLEDPKHYPDYKDLPGETEGQKLRAYADVLEKIGRYHIDDPIGMTCANCMLVCGPTTEESQKRWKMLAKSGIVAYSPDKEPVIFHDYEKAVAQREAYGYENRNVVKWDFYKLQFKNFVKYFGIDFHTRKYEKKYYERLADAIAKAKLEKEGGMLTEAAPEPGSTD